MDVLRRRQWTAVRTAIQGVLRRWHPEAFPPAGPDWPNLDADIVEIYTIVDYYMSEDLLVPHLLAVELRSPAARPSSLTTLRAVAAELLAIDYDAIIDRESQREPI